MKDLLKKIFGITKMEQTIEEMEQTIQETKLLVTKAEQAQQNAETALSKVIEKQKEKNLSAKEKATMRKEPWIAVLETKVNNENVRNGFFELDWNEYFIIQLREAGYGFESDPEEEIVDRWFKDIVRNMLEEEGLDTNRASGFINVVPISKGKSEIS